MGWHGQALETMLDEPEIIDTSTYARLKLDQHLVPEGASELDWAYQHVSNTLAMVLNTYIDIDPTKITGAS